ncbi:MAG: DUF1080 domain-containing protein [Planctomycetes bacterium]|nr:DUF1080 domain-containing protein [Planctomycetota bacterium]
MGRAIDYCTICGDRVPATDLEKGKALEVGDKVYCGKCRAQAPQPAPAPATSRKRTGATGTFPAIRPVGTGTGRLPNVGSQRMPSVHPATTRLAHVVEDEPQGSKSKAPLIAGAVAVLVLLAAVILFSVQNSHDSAIRAAEEKRLSDAKSAFDAVIQFRQQNPDDPDGLLKQIEIALPKCKNSEWSGKLGAEQDDAKNLKKRMDIKKERSGRLDALRSQMATTKDFPALLLEIEKFQQEMGAPGGDPDFATAAKLLGKTAREKRILNAIEEAKAFEVQNPDKFDEVIEKWSAVQMLCDPGFESYAKQAQDKAVAVKTRREEAARKDWEAEKGKVDVLRKARKWDECQKAIRAFIDRWKGSIVIEEAGKLAWEIDAESKAAVTGPGDPVKPDPGKVPPKDWTMLFDQKTPGSWRIGGAKMDWTSKDGTMIGTNNTTEDEAKKDTANAGIGFWFTDKPYAAYEMEMEVTLVKGEALFLLGINGVDARPTAIPLRITAVGDRAQLTLVADKAYTVTTQVRGDSINMAGTGLAGGNWRINSAGDGKDHGAGQFGFALNPGAQIKIRNIRVRAIP